MSDKRLEEEMEQLQESLKDLGYVLCKAWGIIWLAKKLGGAPKPWIQEREIRDRWH